MKQVTKQRLISVVQMLLKEEIVALHGIRIKYDSSGSKPKVQF